MVTPFPSLWTGRMAADHARRKTYLLWPLDMCLNSAQVSDVWSWVKTSESSTCQWSLPEEVIYTLSVRSLWSRIFPHLHLSSLTSVTVHISFKTNVFPWSYSSAVQAFKNAAQPIMFVLTCPCVSACWAVSCSMFGLLSYSLPSS